MPNAVESVFAGWSFPVGLTALMAITAVVYLNGWMALRKTRRDQFTGWRLVSFLAGLAALWIAIASPLETLADELLSAHMIEHTILMSLTPPLVLLGFPVVPLLRGLPRPLRMYCAAPLLRIKSLRRLAEFLVRPRVAWISMNLAFLGWHIPTAYDFAVEHEFWHDLEHICFLATSLLFWWCIILPWPTRQRRSWTIILYLIAAEVINTATSAFLAFCGRPVYAYYAQAPNPFQFPALSDQMLGAVVMWVFGSLAFLIPAAGITFSMLQPSQTRSLYTRA